MAKRKVLQLFVVCLAMVVFGLLLYDLQPHHEPTHDTPFLCGGGGPHRMPLLQRDCRPNLAHRSVVWQVHRMDQNVHE